MGAASAAPQCVGGEVGIKRGKESPSYRGRLSHPIPARTCPSSYSKPWELRGAERRLGCPCRHQGTSKRAKWPKHSRRTDMLGALGSPSPLFPAW